MIEDWVVNPDLAEIKGTTERGLSRYPIKQLWVTEENTTMLLLVSVGDDDRMFGGLGAKIDDVQRLERASISG